MVNSSAGGRDPRPPTGKRRCRWCGRRVRLTRGRYQTHTHPHNLVRVCPGSGRSHVPRTPQPPSPEQLGLNLPDEGVL